MQNGILYHGTARRQLEKIKRETGLYATKDGVVMYNYIIPPVRDALHTAAKYDDDPVILVIKQSRVEGLVQNGAVFRCDFLLPKWYAPVDVNLINGYPVDIFKELRRTTFMF